MKTLFLSIILFNLLSQNIQRNFIITSIEKHKFKDYNIIIIRECNTNKKYVLLSSKIKLSNIESYDTLKTGNAYWFDLKKIDTPIFTEFYSWDDYQNETDSLKLITSRIDFEKNDSTKLKNMDSIINAYKKENKLDEARMYEILREVAGNVRMLSDKEINQLDVTFFQSTDNLRFEIPDENGEMMLIWEKDTIKGNIFYDSEIKGIYINKNRKRAKCP